MKARDIVAGWPRGRTTSHFELWKCEPFRFSSPQAEEEFRANAEYHAKQQQMVTDYLTTVGKHPQS